MKTHDRLMIVALTCVLVVPMLHAQQTDRIDPKNPELKTLPELGRMVGTAPHASHYGQQVFALGDINNDALADWCVSAFHTGTGISPAPVDLLVYRGVRGKLPSVESGQRVGPTEMASNTRFLAAGDWDADGWKDIAVSIQLLGDTTAGGADYDLSRLVIFWGTATGVYSLNDTTRLENGATIWLGPGMGDGTDYDGDGVDDLLTVGNNGFTSGQRVKRPYMMIFRGHHGTRWGRDGIPRTAEWSWWNPPLFRHLYSIDQNCDQAPDLVMARDAEQDVTTGQISILYGRPEGGPPDTSSVVTLDLKPIDGHNALLSDVTGDGTPELLVTCLDETVRIYAGEPGVRLLEQFGSGTDPADPQHGRAYRRPWAELPLPHKLDDAFAESGARLLLNLGDAGLNGSNDIWVYNYPFIVAYGTGRHGECLDSLFDAIIFPVGTSPLVGVLLGDIDGSGVPTMALGFDIADVVQFFKPSKDVPEDYCVPRLPLHGDGIRCGAISSVSDAATGKTGNPTGLGLHAVPNPATGNVQLQWSRADIVGTATISVYDEAGRRVVTLVAPASDGACLWNAAGLAAGSYYITLTVAEQIATTQLQITH